MYYTTKIHKNCRKFFKRIYDCDYAIEEDFLSELNDFGQLKINRFSQMVKDAKDVFEIKNGEGIEISGVIGDPSILLVIPKEQPEKYERFELLLTNYLKNKSQA